MTDNRLSSGVQELIDRLREEGVAEGRQEAEAILENVHEEALEIRRLAEEEAKEIIRQARDDASRFQTAAQDSLRLAFRDTVLSLKAKIGKEFAAQLKKHTGEALQDLNVLKEMIVSISEKALPENTRPEKVKIFLPATPVFGESSMRPDLEGQSRLDSLTKGILKETLEKGVVLKKENTDQKGIRVILVGEDVQIDLTEDSLSQLLLEHLTPRFRAFFENS